MALPARQCDVARQIRERFPALMKWQARHGPRCAQKRARVGREGLHHARNASANAASSGKVDGHPCACMPRARRPPQTPHHIEMHSHQPDPQPPGQLEIGTLTQAGSRCGALRRHARLFCRWRRLAGQEAPRILGSMHLLVNLHGVRGGKGE